MSHQSDTCEDKKYISFYKVGMFLPGYKSIKWSPRIREERRLMKLKRCRKRAHCTSLMGQLKWSNGIVPILPDIQCGGCRHTLCVCSLVLCVSAGEHKAQQMGCMSLRTAQAVNPNEPIDSDGFQTSQWTGRCVCFHAGVTAQKIWYS